MRHRGVFLGVAMPQPERAKRIEGLPLRKPFDCGSFHETPLRVRGRKMVQLTLTILSASRRMVRLTLTTLSEVEGHPDPSFFIPLVAFS